VEEERQEGVQFDRAEYADKVAPPTTCANCSQPLWDTYYDVNGRVCCERCRRDLELAGRQGSGPGRFVRAATFGVLAGAAGAGIWYGVRALTGYEVGLIAILVGFMVGGAVRKGSAGRGGWLYQALAVLLTYASIVSTYVPMIATDLRETARKSDAQAAPSSTATPAATPPAASTKALAGRPLLAAALFGLVVFAIACVAPFLGGFQSLIGLFIIGIGLYEAWKINKRVPIVVTGPFRVGSAPAPDPAAAG
jgi:hypothetical protein